MTDVGTAAPEGRLASDAASDVAAYLMAINDRSARRGTRRAARRLRRRLEAIEGEFGDALPIQRLRLIQERSAIVAELDVLDAGPDITVVERAFLRAADTYGTGHGIGYDAWRELGVRPFVLRHAGIRPGP